MKSTEGFDKVADALVVAVEYKVLSDKAPNTRFKFDATLYYRIFPALGLPDESERGVQCQDTG